MSRKKAVPKPKAEDIKVTDTPLNVERHDAALFKRDGDKWRWICGGVVQAYPKIGYPIIVAYNKNEFAHTGSLVKVTLLEEAEYATELVFVDDDAVVWKMYFPIHTTDIKQLKKGL